MMAMVKAFSRRLLRDQQGHAVVEFALVSTFLLVVFMAVLDIATFTLQQRQLSEALSSSSASAFVNRDAVNFSTIPAYVQTTADLPAAIVTVRCNGNSTCVNSGRTCSCLSSGGAYVASGSCGNACTGSRATSGYYMTIAASSPYTAMIVPANLLASQNVSRSITVRLQ